jgi:hypothetical protein
MTLQLRITAHMLQQIFGATVEVGNSALKLGVITWSCIIDICIYIIMINIYMTANKMYQICIKLDWGIMATMY